MLNGSRLAAMRGAVEPRLARTGRAKKLHKASKQRTRCLSVFLSDGTLRGSPTQSDACSGHFQKPFQRARVNYYSLRCYQGDRTAKSSTQKLRVLESH